MDSSASTRTASAQDGEQPPANRQRHLAPPGAAQGDNRDAAIVNGLQCDGLGGWGRIFSFTESKARTRASVACVAFLNHTNSVPRSATFGREQLVVDGAPTLERLVRARERFPALCVLAINLEVEEEEEEEEEEFTGITDDFIVALVEICPEITDLNLKGCFITDVSIVVLTEKCPRLKSLNISSCEEITDVAIVGLVGSCPLLKSVNLAWDCLITDASIVVLAESCPQLESLNIEGDAITDVSVLALAENCPQLESVNFGSCERITGASIVTLAESCPQLKCVILHDCKLITDVSVGALAVHCPLVIVDLSNCTEITDSDADDGGVVALECCPQLESVNLSGCILTDASIVAFAGSCPRLKSVDLDGCEYITDVSIVALAASCPLLKSVSLSYCELITDASIAALKAALPDVSVER